MSTSKGVALITGSAQGIGRAIVLRLAEDGFDIALNDLKSKSEELKSLAQETIKLGRKTCLAIADVTVEEDVQAMAQGVVNELKRLYVMVANAGIFEWTAELKDWEAVMAVNVRGTFLCFKYAAARMIEQGHGGRLIAASSYIGKVASPFSSAYSASKFAVRGLTQTAALEFGEYGITANSYAPGVIPTAMTESIMNMVQAFAESSPGLLAVLGRSNQGYATKDKGEPVDVAGVVSFLASKEAQYITGQCISVDGGRIFS